MTTETTPTSAHLVELLNGVHISEDRCSATVSDRELEADDPNELRRLLAESLYEVLHSGQREQEELPFRIRDEEFERELSEVVPHRTSTARARVCTPPADVEGPADTVLVERDGVRVWVPAETVLDGSAGSHGSTVTLEVSALRPALSPGFFVVDGSTPRTPGGGAVRVYFNVADWRRVAGFWSRILGYLEDRGVAYRSKVLSVKQMYPRRDAVVVYLAEKDEHVVDGLVEAVDGSDCLDTETSALAERLGPGTAVAREPADTRAGMGGLSFGQHRASVLAYALMDSAAGTASLAGALEQRCVEANIDPNRPARNLNSL
ncbi:T3SS effector HopA1 family protein [Actinopolyspora mortivallis]|uniref:Uncharacterized protein n=1 Tax=Actinopolyspora mortivallis TaxID=33906 RepID=A0A2T0GSG2_ACTMO|nr:T3SS effector HopA1 family protein [Actinopolyspora mortivallis]PRW62045.1 hypothetical protein CEP50_17540 [Actinopolyspora mortivallis]